jgi:membrane protein YdbS with pleckstrin-like domain
LAAIVDSMMSPLHPRQLTLLRIRAGIAAAVLLVFVTFADSILLRETFVPFGLASGAAALLLAAWAVLIPKRRYRSWGYEMAEDELHIQHGLWTRARTVVPFGRVQHIDVTQGPLERRFALGTLVLHTAGTRSSAVGLPGLHFEEAGRIRDHIRSKIRQDLG